MAIGVKNFGKIGVLMGGPSSEREISLKSGKAVLAALKGLRLNAVAVDIKTDNVSRNLRLLEPMGISCAFLALHGYFGEDGRIQGLLDALGIPYTSSGVLASSLAMDKVASRLIFSAKGLKVPRYKLINARSAYSQEGILEGMKFPLVIKPATSGSSIGLSIIEDKNKLMKAMKSASMHDKRVIIEEYIGGRELTVGILGKRALPVIEIIPGRKFFDFQAKYHPGLTQYVVPARLNKSLSEKIKKAALSAHESLSCYGCSRVDIILDKAQNPVILEVNTIPGLTSTSLLPKACKAAGIGFEKLCLKLIDLAYEKEQD
ncbi:MAG: D-alanine--D-alanine ligase [Candidatus Omnitrophota bacterium]